ncbi:PEP-CTERM sorting domain-containing protein [Nitrosomonas sp. HPC101]|uniref:PEP-CTERM sorting domain-containing protein n=1 Tax=Nitrosomonas sp. HPC101 TaxID=1658667 RepID=UPI00136EF8A6|nr:PEP-CTERM sorting domain-containing protein [Nitrosomonas sp. HPC101]MXS85046.1 PEP-CTERM sorting domain-containing protein [Nitrosomonas sp. HPC101]
MEFRKIALAAVLTGSAALASVPAQAGWEILDAWQMNLSGGNNNNIGHLVVGGGFSTVTQELDAAGEVFVGAKFTNLGGLFSITYSSENVPGSGDFGPLSVLTNQIQYSFSGLAGTVTGISSTGEISFSYTPGVGSITLQELGGPTIATLSIADPSGGKIGSFIGTTDVSGTSNITAELSTETYANLFQDISGKNLLPGEIRFALDTTNKYRPGSPLAVAYGCDFSAAGLCADISLTQEGSVNALVRTSNVPEPATLALLALGILGMGAVTRRRS